MTWARDIDDEERSRLAGIRLLAVDIDGTLLTSDHRILPEVRDAFAAARRAGRLRAKIMKIVMNTATPATAPTITPATAGEIAPGSSTACMAFPPPGTSVRSEVKNVIGAGE